MSNAKFLNKTLVVTILISFLVSALTGTVFGFLSKDYLVPYFEKYVLRKASIPGPEIKEQDKQVVEEEKIKVVREESAIIEAVKIVSPAVVSIIITQDVPKLEEYFYEPFGGDEFFKEFFGPFFKFRVPQYRQEGTEKKEIGGGTGFIVSQDGLILTNKHVVSYQNVDYTVFTNDEKKYEARVLARDPVNDIAILKIKAKDLPVVELGDSDKLQIGQTVIAIGNALAEFRNTVSVGVISGLGRSITAGSLFGRTEQLERIIQTDAAVNQGNSGGPLVNLNGQVIGINVAMAMGAENIGFSIPINDAKKSIQDVKEKGRIVIPFLGVRYILVNKTIQEKNNLSVDYGALVIRGEKVGDLAVIPGSAADKAGIQENDIILEIDGERITEDNPLSKIIMKHSVGDKISLKVLHKGEEIELRAVLEERK